MFKRVVCFILTALFLSFPVIASDGEIYVEMPDVEYFLDMGSVEKYTAGLGITAQQYEQLKDAVYTATRNCETECDISAFAIRYNATTYEYLNYFVKKGDPESFHVSGLGASVSPNGNYIKLRFSYQYSQQTYNEMKAAALAVADELLAGVEGNDALDDVKKALILHDRLAVLCEYDVANLEAGTVPYDDYNIYGALVNKICVCEGYTKAYSYLLDRIGIENYYCDSLQLGHIWNIVYIDGEKYHVDVTFDDPTEDVTGYVQHDFFLCSTAKMMQNSHNAQDYDASPVSTLYDDAFWTSSHSSFALFGNDIYYVDNSAKTLNLWSGDNRTAKKTLAGRWRSPSGGIFLDNYSCLTTDGTYVYYSLPNEVVRYDTISDTTSSMYTYTPGTANQYFCIYGIKTENSVLTLDVFNTPLFESTTKADYEFTVGYELPNLLGDVDCNGKVNGRDLQAFKKYIAGNSADIDFVFCNADINHDGKANGKDFGLMKKIIAGAPIS